MFYSLRFRLDNNDVISDRSERSLLLLLLLFFISRRKQMKQFIQSDTRVLLLFGRTDGRVHY